MTRAEQQAEKRRKEKYARLKAAGKCILCVHADAISGRVVCDTCHIGGLWHSGQSTKGYEPISLNRLQFIVWYRAKRAKCAGFCEWCKQPFGSSGPVADHDHKTGEPRALICRKCNYVEGFGLERLKAVVAAIEQWQSGHRDVIELPTESFPPHVPNNRLEVPFNRWFRSICVRRDATKNARIQTIIAEMRTRSSSEKEVREWFNLFRGFVESKGRRL